MEGKKIFIPKRPGEPDVTHADIKKIKENLNWKPKKTLKEGINKVLQNIDYWKNASKKIKMLLKIGLNI